MNWTLASPEIVLALCGLVILLVGVARNRREDTFLCAMLTLGAFLVTGLLTVSGALGLGFQGQFVADPFAVMVKLLILSGASIAVVLSLDYNRHHGMERFEFPVLTLFSTVGMMVMVSASNFMTLYMGLELMSLAIYVLAAFARDELRSAEAGLKYFVLGSLASGLLLYGISLIYGFAGTMDFSALREALAHPAGTSPGLTVGVVFVIAGLAFKISAAPFHMWTPDVYEGSPTPVTAFMGTAPKVAAIAMMLRTLVTPFHGVLVQWQHVVALISVVSMVWGALAAIGQTSIKRLMAYSSIGHMGYALVGLAAGSQAGIRGLLIYLVTYVFMNTGTFACILAMRRRGRQLEKVSDLAGAGRTDPALALLLAIFMFSMAGIPPMSGFFGKLYVFLAAVQAGEPLLWGLAVIGVLTSVIGAYYYLRVVKVMYFDDASEGPFEAWPTSVSVVAVGSAIFTALFFLFPAPILAAADLAAKALLR
ncbi:NADH-quinone oxidoreductase subunit NuoN [Granulibacter bethesdensis]|uniref:NADH-quinone oxidoreductase subunit N n=1 Tax=Granulibacter bethesdensis (strain ATCC BAA-1260 / CGDNIH1) TaxID=391165 RepID=NUON_GRABC|nr:NADH-quinone oxidoreductase subunit NuoN [Granulibacter bethesdensis]Q0BSL5.1 RecName: Full=NADH-quinone oxidoreductase subunit N; AltName: Full=NADH dehydrogenase I subunit N; AltName: Full=NDH-1 subunit N [Granulibacter bethesdensis CGDNIH1]ABI62187.1 NADH-quinone oxidoreductase chain N [Granulibacter bethesdensis CGDNIH1]APH52013.1 NADH-quinone oxidoreductase chain N [Granulibacter bethesdensis]APH64703.1 NADH-quinone oxidoreductase chain N [Granulibacter bethesdensis]